MITFILYLIILKRKKKKRYRLLVSRCCRKDYLTHMSNFDKSDHNVTECEL